MKGSQKSRKKGEVKNGNQKRLNNGGEGSGSKKQP